MCHGIKALDHDDAMYGFINSLMPNCKQYHLAFGPVALMGLGDTYSGLPHPS